LVIAGVLLMNNSENTQVAETGDTSVTSTATKKVAIPLVTNSKNATAASSSNKNSPSSATAKNIRMV